MYDALLLVSFGGPERREDVIPFLQNVLRGRNVPRERMLAVADLAFPFPVREVVPVLDGRDGEDAARALDLLHRHFGKAEMADLALVLEAPHGPELVLLRNRGIDAVELPEVDPFQAQPPQAAGEQAGEKMRSRYPR